MFLNALLVCLSLYSFLDSPHQLAEKKDYDLVVLGHTVYDVALSCTDEDKVLSSFDVKKGSFRYITESQRQQLMARPECTIKQQQPGGGLSNTAAVVSALGSQKVMYMGIVADDQIGNSYIKKMVALNVKSQIDKVKDDKGTGMVAAIISEDGERTFLVSVGVSKDIQRINLSLPSAKIFATEGYLWSDDQSNNEKLKTFLKEAHDKKALTAFALCDAALVRQYATEWRDLIRSGVVDIVFADREQLDEFFSAGQRDLKEYKSVVFIETKGKKGALVHVYDKHEQEQRTYTIHPHLVEKPVDTTGAGDAFMGGFLRGLLTSKHGECIRKAVFKSGDLASCAAAEIIQQFGPKPFNAAKFKKSVQACTDATSEQKSERKEQKSK